MKKTFAFFTLLFVSLFTFSASIQDGTYFSSQAGTKSVRIADVTEKEVSIHFQYKNRYDEARSTNVQAENVTRKFTFIRNGLFSTNDGVTGGDGFYLQQREELLIVTQVEKEKILEVFYLTKKEDKERLKTLAKEAKALKGNYFSQGITSAVHEKYVNQIVFSKNIKAVELQNESESEFINEWNLSDPLFIRVYLDQTTANSFLKEFKADYETIVYGYDYYLDGKQLKENAYTTAWNNHSSKLVKTWTTFKECAVCEEETYQTMVFEGFKEAIVRNLNKLTVGTHTLELNFFIKNNDAKKVLSKGELKLTITQASLTKFTSNKIYWEIPEAKFVNKTYEQEILKIMNHTAKVNGWKEKFTKVTLVRDFEPIHNVLTGAITGRHLGAVVYATYSDGHCTYQYYDFKQQYTGKGNYAPTLYLYATGRQVEVPCNFTK